MSAPRAARTPPSPMDAARQQAGLADGKGLDGVDKTRESTNLHLEHARAAEIFRTASFREANLHLKQRIAESVSACADGATSSIGRHDEEDKAPALWSIFPPEACDELKHPSKLAAASTTTTTTTAAATAASAVLPREPVCEKVPFAPRPTLIRWSGLIAIVTVAGSLAVTRTTGLTNRGACQLLSPGRLFSRARSALFDAEAEAGVIAHGAFEGSVVRVLGDPVLTATAAEVTADDLRCGGGADGDGAPPTIEGGCGARIEEWVALMLRGLAETQGACIAAPQVGVSKRLIVMSIPAERVREEHGLRDEQADEHPSDGDGSDGATGVMPPAVLVNPVLRPLAGDGAPPTREVWESCLSLPSERVVVRRHDAVRYTAQRLDGTSVEGVARGRLALTLQHEVDHLDGVLMTHGAVDEPYAGRPRADGLGGVTSTEHWELMRAPGYSLRTFTLPGAALIDGRSSKGVEMPDSRWR